MIKGRKQLIGMLAAANVMGLVMAGNVMAEENSKKLNSAQVKVGMFKPTGDMDDADYDNGGDFSGSYGRYLNKFLILEAGFDAFGSEQNLSGRNDQAGSYTQDNYLVGVAGFVTLKGEYSAGPVDLFGGFGGGIYSVTLDSEIDSSRLGDLDTDDSDGVFGVHVVAGVNYNINQRFFVGVEGKYRWTDDVEIRETVAAIPIEYTGDLSGYMVTFNAGIRF